MDNILPIEVRKINFLKKITNFIKKIFYHANNKKQGDLAEIFDGNDEVDSYKGIEEFNSILIKEINQKKTVQEIIPIIEKNPEIMKHLSVHKLEIIDNYYQEQIEEYKNKIAKVS